MIKGLRGGGDVCIHDENNEHDGQCEVGAANRKTRKILRLIVREVACFRY